jgi:alkylation response protein AidB-like acyl-CoA dehydrogenase
MQYKAPVDSTLFLLRDVLKFDNDLLEPILTEIAKLSEETIAPTNQEGDYDGCVRDSSGVHVPDCFHEPYKQFAEGGWIGLSVPEQYGGQGMPFTLAVAANEYVSSSNMAWSLFPGITRGAIQALLVSGSDALKETFIQLMLRGEYTGTMCLTEPHCGTDLGLLKTKAVEHGAEWKITGQKIFISGGEHDLTNNILHLVLARAEGDPEGVKGISLFAVPKIHRKSRERNNVSCGSIESKMGIHGSPTCVMNFDGAIGYLVGERCKGLQAMFIMMNELRLGCAIHGLSQSELAYQNALQYAKERMQGTNISEGKNGSVVPIINHPDIRRMLMDVRCINEAARLLVLEAATLVDVVNAKTNGTTYPDIPYSIDVDDAEDRLGLMTPVLKGVITDYGVENAIKMQQVWGGHGYVRDNGMEQIVRDARIAMIYEGANGIQALDLVGRKLPKNMGRAITNFLRDSTNDLNEAYNKGNINHIVQPMALAIDELKQATEWLAANGMKNPNDAGAASYPYMKMFGLVLLGLAHIRICLATDDKARHTTATYFMENVLPESSFLLKKIRQGSSTMMALTPDEF